MQVKALTYEEYLQQVDGVSCSRIEEEQALIVKNFREVKKIYSKLRPFTYLIDYSKANYLFLEETCQDLLGYPMQYFLETGHRGYFAKMHPGDYMVLTNIVFKDLFKFLEYLPMEKYNNYIFSFNYRFLSAKGEYITLMQKHSYIPGSSIGNPSGAVGNVYDITHFKNDLSIVLTIEETSLYNNKLINNFIYKKTYPVYDVTPFQQMSKRELEILKFMAEGLSSKQIANRLRISINTINNHRKNMLHKMNCKSSSELLSHAVKRGLL